MTRWQKGRLNKHPLLVTGFFRRMIVISIILWLFFFLQSGGALALHYDSITYVPLKTFGRNRFERRFLLILFGSQTRLDKSRPRFSPFVLRNRLLAFATYQPFLDYRRLANVPSMSCWKMIAYLCFGGRSLAFGVLLENN